MGRNLQVRFLFEGICIFLRLKNLSFINKFSKSDIGWPQQPLTEKELKFKLGFHDSVKKIFFQNIKIKLFLPSN
jgi:hypothetical protein